MNGKATSTSSSAPPTPRLNGLKKQREFYSGKRKDHTLKSQLIVRKKDERIIHVDHAKGPATILPSLEIHEDVVVFADSGC